MGKHFVVWMIVPHEWSGPSQFRSGKKKLPGGQVLPRVVPGVDPIFVQVSKEEVMEDLKMLGEKFSEITHTYIYIYINKYIYI